MEFDQEKVLVTFEKLKKEVAEIIGNKDINPTFLILLFVLNFSLVKQLTEEKFHEKFCKIVNVIKNSKELNEIFEINN